MKITLELHPKHSRTVQKVKNLYQEKIMAALRPILNILMHVNVFIVRETTTNRPGGGLKRDINYKSVQLG